LIFYKEFYVANEQQPTPRKMTDEEGKDMGESIRRMKALLERAPKKIEGFDAAEPKPNE
jgi:sulfur relay (sulfurtransferase) DsrC/TusE family protein